MNGKVGDGNVGDIKASSLAKIPYGWLECNGQAVLRSTYSELFTKFSTQLYDDPSSTQDQTHTLLSRYGEGDGLTTFNLPDYRECVLIGVGTNNKYNIASHDVYTVGQFKDDQLQGHKHNDSGHEHGLLTSGYAGSIDVWSLNFYPRGTPFNSEPNVKGAKADKNYANIGLPTKYDDYYGNPRIDSTTHGKQVGITYIIKAL